MHLDESVGAKVWTVLDGVLALCTSLSDGRRQIVCLSMPGDVLCPVSDVDGADLWAESLTGSSVCEFDLGHRAELTSYDAELGAELLRIAQDRVRVASMHLVTLGRLDGMERVCLFLADIAWRIGRETPNGWRVPLPLSREDIADYLGLNAETVSRILSRVKKAKLATFLSPTDYLVPDLHALASRAPLTPPHAPGPRVQKKWGLRLL